MNACKRCIAALRGQGNCRIPITPCSTQLPRRSPSSFKPLGHTHAGQSVLLDLRSTPTCILGRTSPLSVYRGQLQPQCPNYFSCLSSGSSSLLTIGHYASLKYSHRAGSSAYLHLTPPHPNSSTGIFSLPFPYKAPARLCTKKHYCSLQAALPSSFLLRSDPDYKPQKSCDEHGKEARGRARTPSSLQGSLNIAPSQLKNASRSLE